ncbi:Fms-interacting protein-domain-containing protein [Pilobolus umbonatus]|nr:Fms-interacting protein-domain-containing protein [Pilobolus umbonatus]
MSSLESNFVMDVSAAVNELENILAEQLQKKLEGRLEQNHNRYEYEKLQQTFDKLKDLHTRSYASTRDSKQATTEAKERMNEKQVDLQDVIYEKRHILEEIVQCREFRSVYQDVELIPLKDFLSQAGPEYLENSDNPHQLMINRLKYELVVRKELKEQEESLQLERAELIKDNRKAQKKVDQFDKLLDDFVQSALPVEEALMTVNNKNQPEAMDTT